MSSDQERPSPLEPGDNELPRMDVFLATYAEDPDDTLAAAADNGNRVRLAQLGDLQSDNQAFDTTASLGSEEDRPLVIAYAKPEMEPFVAEPNPERRLLPKEPKPTGRVPRGHRRRSKERHERVTTRDTFGMVVCTCDKVCVCIPVCTCDTVPVCSCVSYHPPRRSPSTEAGGYCLCVPVCRCVPVAH